jgi:hypothetical protein
MDLKDFIAIKGKGELFRVMVKTAKGIIVESLNESKTKFKVQPNLSVLLLYDITIFSNDNSDLYLRTVFMNIYKKDGLKISIDVKDDSYKLREYFKEVVPTHDEEKVYISDIKKILKWYMILAEYYPDVIANLEKEEEAAGKVESEKSDAVNTEVEEESKPSDKKAKPAGEAKKTVPKAKKKTPPTESKK